MVSCAPDSSRNRNRGRAAARRRRQSTAEPCWGERRRAAFAQQRQRFPPFGIQRCCGTTCIGLFLSSGRFWVLLPVLCSERERPFFVPSPAIRFPERAEGVEGATLAKLGALRAGHAEGR